MVYDFEHPEVPFDYWESQAASPHPAQVFDSVPRSMIRPGETVYLHVKVRPNGPLFSRRRTGRSGWETPV
jgi:hypothetical protein